METHLARVKYNPELYLSSYGGGKDTRESIFFPINEHDADVLSNTAGNGIGYRYRKYLGNSRRGDIYEDFLTPTHFFKIRGILVFPAMCMIRNRHKLETMSDMGSGTEQLHKSRKIVFLFYGAAPAGVM